MGSIQVDGHTDSMLACYPGDGAFYTAHIDADPSDPRKLTLVLYLSNDWVEEHGGCLHILDPDTFEWQRVAPKSGTLAVFRADDILHQVRPSYAPRYAMTVWMVNDGLDLVG